MIAERHRKSKEYLTHVIKKTIYNKMQAGYPRVEVYMNFDPTDYPTTARNGGEKPKKARQSQRLAGKRVDVPEEIESGKAAKKGKVATAAEEVLRKSSDSATHSGKSVKIKTRALKRERVEPEAALESEERKRAAVTKKSQNQQPPKAYIAAILELAYGKPDAKKIASHMSALNKEIDAEMIPQDGPYRALIALAARYEQLAHLPNFEKKPLSPKERLQLAYQIEVEIPKIKNIASGQFISSTPAANAKKADTPPRDLFVTHKGRIIVMAKPEFSKVASKGSYKEVFSAVKLYQVGTEVLSKKTEELKTEKTMKPDIQARISLSDEDEVASIDREMAYYERFKAAKIPNIAKLRFYTDITGLDGAKDEATVKVAGFNKYDGSLEKKTGFTLSQKIKIFKDASVAVKGINDNGVIHGDLKADNILYREEEDDDLTIGVIDFGLSFENKGAKTVFPEFSYADGSYGTLYATAPELIGDKKFTGSLGKTESWALGLAFYEIYFEKQAPWRTMIPAPEVYADLHHSKKKVLLNVLRTEIANFANDCTKKAAVLEKLKKPTLEQKTELAIYKLLLTDPAKRLSLADAEKAFSNLK